MDHIADLERDGRALLDAGHAAGLDAPVPACPGWDVRRLLAHTGKVLERTTMVVGEGLTGPPARERFLPVPDDDVAFDRFAAMLSAAVGILARVDEDTPCFNFTGAHETAAFWRRRMANEVAIHRVDAEAAAGRPSSVGTERAVDGIDELLTEMLPMSAPHNAPTLDASVHLHCTDTDGEWLTVFTAGRPTTTREHAKGDLAVRGPASPLFLWAWNRAPIGLDGVEAFGDTALLDVWHSITP